METRITIIDGNPIKHKEIIHHNSKTKFSWKDRLRILFGQPSIIKTEIFTMNDEITVLASRVTTFVPKIIPKRTQDGTAMIKELSQQEIQAMYSKKA